MDETNHHQLRDLAVAARQGDVGAYGRIVELTQGAVAAAVRQVVDDPVEAEDLTQETYLRGYRNLDTLEDPVALVAWLRRIARRAALNHCRAQRRTFVADVNIDSLPAVEPDAGDGERRDEALARAMVDLSPEERRLCERYYHGGWTTARLATEASVGEAAIRKRLQRIRDHLRRTMAVTTTDLPQRIVELISRPNLTALPENPVGAMWEEFRRAFEGFQLVDLPEKVDSAELRRVFQANEDEALDERCAALERQEGLRTDLTIPMLITAAGMEGWTRLIATGKTYRVRDEEGPTRLQAFHQAEVLWLEDDLDEWRVMGPLTELIGNLCDGARVRVVETRYPLYSDRGWEVDAQWRDGEWHSVAGWARMSDSVVEQLGRDPATCGAVGLGMGLERLACLRYGIDDIRKVAAHTL